MRFYDIRAESLRVQVIANAKIFEGEESEFIELHNSVRRGDIVGIEGYPGYSNSGEFSMFAKNFIVLSPCLHMPPSVKYGLTEKVSTLQISLNDTICLGNKISSTVFRLDV